MDYFKKPQNLGFYEEHEVNHMNHSNNILSRKRKRSTADRKAKMKSRFVDGDQGMEMDDEMSESDMDFIDDGEFSEDSDSIKILIMKRNTSLCRISLKMTIEVIRM